jgi:putative DNA primase/helicase
MSNALPILEDPVAGQLLNCTDLGNGLKFAEVNRHTLRYCHPWKKWLVWDDQRWHPDDDGAVYRLARLTINDMYQQARYLPKEQRLKLLEHALATEKRKQRVDAMIALAASELPVRPDDLDRDHWLFNVDNGTLNLRTGDLRAHDRTDLITCLAPVSFNRHATCALWEKFLCDIFCQDAELIAFVQELMGYALTGDVREHILPIFWGIGANGKSTFLNVILAMLGTDYAIPGSRDLLMAHKYDKHPTVVAHLFRKRLVVCSETGESRRRDESLVKQLTGADPITARRMREDFWTFLPTHKIILQTSHKPEVRGQDEGIWRRLRLVPFLIRVADAEQDKNLGSKLLAEREGILNWLRAGCLRWQKHGLSLPAAVKSATQEYKTQQEVLAEFLEECCQQGPDYRCKASAFYGVWSKWCKRSGVETGTRTALTQAMKLRGFHALRSNGTCYLGVALRPDADLFPDESLLN